MNIKYMYTYTYTHRDSSRETISMATSIFSSQKKNAYTHTPKYMLRFFYFLKYKLVKYTKSTQNLLQVTKN